MNNILLRKSFRIVLATLSTIFMFILIWIMLDCFPRDVIVEEKELSYDSESGINYIVSSESEMVNCYHYFKTDKEVDMLYKYYVTATIKYVENGKTYYGRKTILVESVKAEAFDTNFIKVNTEVNVPYSNLFLEEFGDMTIDKNNVSLDIEFIVDTDLASDINDPEYINTESNVSINIPFNKMRSNKNNRTFKKKDLGTAHKEKTSFNSYLFLLVWLCFIAIIPVTVLSYASLFNLSNYDEYKRKLRAIKKKYGSFLTPRKKVPSFKKKEIIEVDDFLDLLEYLDEEDIVFFEKDPGSEAWFYLEKKKEVYLYILKLDHSIINMMDNTAKIKAKKHKK